MADETGIINGSYRGIPIAIDSGTVDGGRKVSVKQFPGRDTQTVEDLGLQPRKYSLDIIVSAKTNQDYFSYRNNLIAALEDKEPAELIHPLFGRIDDVVAVSYSLNESFSSFGDTTVTVNFEVNSSTGIPQSSGNVITQVQESNKAVNVAAVADISNNYKVENKFAGNFGSAVDKVDGIIGSVEESFSFLGEEPQDLDGFANFLLGISAVALVSSPAVLGDTVAELFARANVLYESAESTLESFAGMFGFGDDDTEIMTTTVGLAQRDQNNNVLNGSVSALALGYAYQSASLIEYQTTDEIDAVAARLDDQYAATQESGSSQEVKDAITDMRVNVLGLFDQARVNASQVISVNALPTTGRLLAYSYYGNDDFGESIIDLNSITDVSFVEGDVEILTA